MLSVFSGSEIAMFLRKTAKHGKIRAEYWSVSPLFITFFGSTFPFPQKRHRSGTCHYDECRETSQHTLNTHNDPAQPSVQRTSPAQALQTELGKCLQAASGGSRAQPVLTRTRRTTTWTRATTTRTTEDRGRRRGGRRAPGRGIRLGFQVGSAEYAGGLEMNFRVGRKRLKRPKIRQTFGLKAC